MILAISTSSPVVTVALLAASGEVLYASSDVAKHRAAASVERGIAESIRSAQLDLTKLTSLAVDVGPGSFTGTRVGVSMAKVIAWSLGVRLHAITAFDLVDAGGVVYIPARKASYFVRRPGSMPVETSEVPDIGKGYGLSGREETFPSFAQVGLSGLGPAVDPVDVIPYYVAEPNISIPKAGWGERG